MEAKDCSHGNLRGKDSSTFQACLFIVFNYCIVIFIASYFNSFKLPHCKDRAVVPANLKELVIKTICINCKQDHYSGE